MVLSINPQPQLPRCASSTGPIRFRSAASDKSCRGRTSHWQKRAGKRQQRSIGNLDLPQVKPRSQPCCSGLDNIARSMAAEQEAGPVTLTAPRRANKGVMNLMTPSSPSRIGGGTDVSHWSRSRSTSTALHKCDADGFVDMLTLLEDPLGLSLFRR